MVIDSVLQTSRTPTRTIAPQPRQHTTPHRRLGCARAYLVFDRGALRGGLVLVVGVVERLGVVVDLAGRRPYAAVHHSMRGGVQ